MQKSLIWVGAFVGGAIGGYIPVLFGASYLSISSIIFSTMGGVIGIWAGYELAQLILG